MMNLIDALEYQFEKNPNGIACVSPHGRITYRQLYNTLRYYQRNTKIAENKIYLLSYHSTVQYIFKLLLIFIKKAWAVPVPKDIKDNELTNIKLATKAEDYPDTEDMQVIDIDNADILVRPKGHETGVLHMTSGTTGNPKFCIRTLYNLSMEGISYRNTLDITCEDKILNMPPLTHSYALGASLCTSIIAGAALYIFDEFQPRIMMKVIAREKITAVILVPAMAQILSKLNNKEKDIFSSVRILLSGSGSIDEELNNKFMEKYGVGIMNNYGSTETGGLITRLEMNHLLSLGKVMDGVSIKIINSHGANAAINEEGELYVKTESMSRSYLNDESMEFDEDGFLNTHDIVEIDAKNNIYLKCRKKELISVGGRKVYPNEIADVILRSDKVEECLVTSYLKKNGSEIIVAFIQTHHHMTDHYLRCYCKEYLSDYKVPNRFILINKFPRNNIGKIKYSELMELLKN